MPRYLVPALHALLAALYLYHHNGISSQSTMRTIGALTIAAGTATILAHPTRWPARINGIPLILLGLLYTGLFGTRIQLSTISVLLAASALPLPRPAAVLVTALFLALNLQWFPRADLPLMAIYFAFLALRFPWEPCYQQTPIPQTSPTQS